VYLEQHNKGAIDWIEKNLISNIPNRMLLCVTDGSGFFRKGLWPLRNEQQDYTLENTPKCALKGEL
jgi:hypothetical protein